MIAGYKHSLANPWFNGSKNPRNMFRRPAPPALYISQEGAVLKGFLPSHGICGSFSKTETFKVPRDM